MTFRCNLVLAFNFIVSFNSLQVVVLYLFYMRFFELQKYYATDGFPIDPGYAEDWLHCTALMLSYMNLFLHHGNGVCSSLSQNPTCQSFLWHTFMSPNFNCAVVFDHD